MKRKEIIKEFSRLAGIRCLSVFVTAFFLITLPTVCFAVFSSEVVDSEGDVGKYTSMAADSSGNLHISYYDSTNGALKYATDASGTWASVTVDTVLGSDMYAGYTSIAIDSSDRVHISYRDYTNEVLKHATNSGVSPGAGNCSNTDWDCEAVDSLVGTWAGYTSIGIDSSDRIHVSYSSSIRVLRYATNQGVTPGEGSCTNTDWDCETVDNAGNTYWTAIAIDSSDRVHISYEGTSSRVLRYATTQGVIPGAGTCTSTDWDCETVENVFVGGSNTSIAIDSQDKVHIIYQYWNASQLKHATNRGVAPGTGNCTNTDWNCEVMESLFGIGHNSIAVDSADNIHVAYAGWILNISNNIAKYATNSSGSWHIELFDSTKIEHPSIALDSADRVHIGYRDNVNLDLRHAKDDSRSWVAETVNSVASNSFYGPSIATDSLRNVHLSYIVLWGGVMHATDSGVSLGTGNCTNTDWNCAMVENIGYGHSSIDIDSTDNIHIGYSYMVGTDLYYATNRNVAPGSGNCHNNDWNCELIDAGLYASLVLDSSDSVHIVYYGDAVAELDLRYATNQGVSPGTGNCTSTNFNCETVDSTEDVGRAASVAIDSLGKLHVSYIDNTNQALRYATNRGVSPGAGNCTHTDWACETVESGIGIYNNWYDTSIAVDSAGRAHISYYDAVNADLRYATNRGVSAGSGNCVNTDWNCEAVDSAGAVGAYSSIAIDSRDKVHISYYNANIDYLKYATNVYGSWITWMQHPVGSNGYTAIATDSCDNVHMATNGVTYVSHVLDTDNDGIRNDGNYSCVEDDNPCTGGETENCDDNCPDTPNPGQEDTDGDMVGDACDNCREVENWDQRDTNYPDDDNPVTDGMQHYGNMCDPDFDNDGIVSILDLALWRQNVGEVVPPAPDDIDVNGDGAIWLQDLAVWRRFYGTPPGPGIGD